MFGQLKLQNGKNNICDETFNANMSMDVATYLLEPSRKIGINIRYQRNSDFTNFGKLTIRYLEGGTC